MKIRTTFFLACLLSVGTPAAAEVAVASGGQVKLDAIGAFDQSPSENL